LECKGKDKIEGKYKYRYKCEDNCKGEIKLKVMLKVKVKVNVESSLYKPGVSQRVGRGIALIFLDRSSRSL